MSNLNVDAPAWKPRNKIPVKRRNHKKNRKEKKKTNHHFSPPIKKTLLLTKENVDDFPMLGEDDNVKDSRKKSFRSNKRSKKEICIRPNFSKQFVKRFFEAKSRNLLKK
jgi:hypothetical protein